MPMPNWWRHLNKRVFNPLATRNPKYDMLTHVGRTSGKTYRTPLEAIPVPGGFATFLMYGGNRTDWVKNTLASGSAVLTKDGREIPLHNPRIVSFEEIESELPPDTYRPHAFLKVTELLRVDEVGT